MDLTSIQQIIKPFIEFFSSIVLSGVASTSATQILKLKVIPIPASRYPRVVAGVTSALATLVAYYVTSLNVVFDSIWTWLAMAIGSLLVATITYNNIIKGSVAEEVVG